MALLYTQQLRQRAADLAKSEILAENARARMRPLIDRLRSLLASIPEAEQRQGLSIEALRVKMKARGRGHSYCHIGELADALRQLGFVRSRRRRGDGSFRARWYPK